MRGGSDGLLCLFTATAPAINSQDGLICVLQASTAHLTPPQAGAEVHSVEGQSTANLQAAHELSAQVKSKQPKPLEQPSSDSPDLQHEVGLRLQALR